MRVQDADTNTLLELARVRLHTAGDIIEEVEERESFSLLDVIRDLQRGMAGAESRSTRALLRELPGARSGGGIQVPWRYLARTMATTPGQAGGFLVGTQTIGLADTLRPWSIAVSGGLHVVAGLKGQGCIPRSLIEPEGQWVAEGVAPTSIDPTYGLASMMSRTYVGVVKMSWQLIMQSPQGEAFLRQQLLRAVARAADAAVFAGAGGARPLGIVNTPGIGSVDGATFDWADVAAMLELLADAGLDDRNAMFIASPDVRELLMTREGLSGSGKPIWNDDRIANRTALTHRDMPDQTLVAGDFSTGVLGMWGVGPELTFSRAASAADFNAGVAALRVVINADVCFPRPEAFVKAHSIT